MGKHPSRFYIWLASKQWQEHRARGHWASPALLWPQRNWPFAGTAETGPVHLPRCSQPAQGLCMAVGQVLQCPHSNTWENFIFLSGLALEMGYHISPTLLLNKGMFIPLPGFFYPSYSGTQNQRLSTHPPMHPWAPQLKPVLLSLSQPCRRIEPLAFSSNRAVCFLFLGFLVH